MNVFKKCLREEFGKNRYRHYVRICEEEMEQKIEKPTRLEDKEIFKDMYEILHRKSEEYIQFSVYQVFSLHLFLLPFAFISFLNIYFL